MSESGPVGTIEEYCAALETWFRLIQENARAYDEGGREGPEPHGYSYAQHLPHILTDIHKSNLLARLIYGGQELRERPCPQHEGRWSGLDICKHGCGSTGWLPNGWPDEAPRCDDHPEEPAVGFTFNTATGERALCWDCYREEWPMLCDIPPDEKP